MKEKKVRVEDAPHATRASAGEGIVPGGGAALLRAALRHAASIASLMLTTEAMIAEIPEKVPALAHGGYGAEGMDY